METWLEMFARANFLRSADTAHDLKTPLNVAVLNLELLRMRLRKLTDGNDDEKIAAYTRAIELELRRMGRIFDAFFLLSTPPRNEGEPVALDVVHLAREAASASGLSMAGDAGTTALAHESRIRQALKLFFEAASRMLEESDRQFRADQDATSIHLLAVGTPQTADFELSKLFKFYYTDPQGNPDLSLAVARLIAETYGGELSASEERGKVSLRLSLPVGAR